MHRRTVPGRRRSKRLTIRLTEREERELQEWALRKRAPMAHVARDLLLQAARQPMAATPPKENSPHTPQKKSPPRVHTQSAGASGEPVVLVRLGAHPCFVNRDLATPSMAEHLEAAGAMAGLSAKQVCMQIDALAAKVGAGDADGRPDNRDTVRDWLSSWCRRKPFPKRAAGFTKPEAQHSEVRETTKWGD